MSQQDLLNKILLLNPNANCCVWENNIGEYMGEGKPLERDGYLLSWNATNSLPPPTQAELDAVVKRDVDADVEVKRKALRDNDMSKDLAIKAAFQIEKRTNPSLKFTDYLDQLEAGQV